MRLKDTIGKKIAIHCPDEWMVDKLMDAYDELKLERSGWIVNREDICYETSTYKVEFNWLSYCKDNGYKIIHFNDLEFGDDIMKNFTKSDMVIGKHAYKRNDGKVFAWEQSDITHYSKNLKDIDGEDYRDITEIYELTKIAEINQPEIKELTQEELIKLAEEKYGMKVKVKEEN